MAFVFGGYIAQYRGPIAIPRPLPERYADPTYDGEDDPDTSVDLLAALYEGKVHRLEIVARLPDLTLRDIEVPVVAFHRDCVVVLDNDGPMSAEFEGSTETRHDQRLAAFSSRPEVAKVMVFWFHGHSDTYAFAVFENGARTRRWSVIPSDDGVIGVDEGTPLPTEPTEDADGEARVEGATKALLGDTTVGALTSADGPAFSCDRG